MSQSNLSSVVALLDRCSVDELRQLQALIAVRIGEVPSVLNRGPSQKAAGNIRAKRPNKATKGSSGVKNAGANPSAKRARGNPQRKSQYATHPLFQAYSTARKAVELVAKKEKVSFKDVTGEARDAYDSAFSAWIQAKSGFRRSTSDENSSDCQSEPTENAQREGGRRSLSPDSNTVPPRDEREIPAKQNPRKRIRFSSSPGGSKYAVPPEGWNPRSRDWSSLNYKERKAAHRGNTSAARAPPRWESDEDMRDGE